MKTAVIAYVSLLVSMLVLDGAWLGITVKRIYRPLTGNLLTDTPNYGAAVVFYLIYTICTFFLVVHPALRGDTDLKKVFTHGAVLGLMAYATYDLTNQATLKGWPVALTIIDIGWGTLLTGAVASLSVCFTRIVR